MMGRRLAAELVAAALMVAIIPAARARGHHWHHARPRFVAAYQGGYGPRPGAWCGWYMRQLVGRDPGPAYNLARNWAHWGSAASGPAPGVIGVLPHHVFRVVSVPGPGRVVAISGNDGHQVRTRERSTRGVIAWRM